MHKWVCTYIWPVWWEAILQFPLCGWEERRLCDLSCQGCGWLQMGPSTLRLQNLSVGYCSLSAAGQADQDHWGYFCHSDTFVTWHVITYNMSWSKTTAFIVYPLPLWCMHFWEQDAQVLWSLLCGMMGINEDTTGHRPVLWKDEKPERMRWAQGNRSTWQLSVPRPCSSTCF